VLAYLNLDNLHDPGPLARTASRPPASSPPPWRPPPRGQDPKALEEAALTDPLTGLPNRRAFERLFLEELKRAERYGYPLSLAVLDLKGFKAINDRLGHAAGDLALVRVAQALPRSGATGTGSSAGAGTSSPPSSPTRARRGP
jgi:hypothetical protein